MRQYCRDPCTSLGLDSFAAATADQVHDPSYRPRLGASKSSNKRARIGSLPLIRPMCDC